MFILLRDGFNHFIIIIDVFLQLLTVVFQLFDGDCLMFDRRFWFNKNLQKLWYTSILDFDALYFFASLIHL